MRRRALRLLKLMLLGCLLAAASGSEAMAADVPAAAQAAFLRDRDPTALLTALEAAPEPAAAGWHGLALLAAGRLPRGVPPDGQGTDALPAVVLALRSLDLTGAQQHLRRAQGEAGRPAAWLQALLHLRRGDEGGAVGALLAPPLFVWERDAFPLALLGRSLLRADRRLLAAGVRAALARAAARGRVAALHAVALAAAAWDRESAPRAFAFALRALRRMGEDAEATRLLSAAPRVGLAKGGGALALEAALLAWASGRSAAMPQILAGPPRDGAPGAWLALRRAGRKPRVPIPGGWRHEPGRWAHASATARLATALGRPTRAAEVASWARKAGLETWHAGTMRAFLEAQGYQVLEAAGDPRVGDTLLRAGLPFVLLRLAPGDATWRAAPSVVHGYDRRTGLWLLDTPDGNALDVTLRIEATKARILAAAPPEKVAAVRALRGGPAARVGARIARALEAADRGDLDGALARLGPEAPSGGAVQDLYRGVLWYRHAAGRSDGERLRKAGAALARSRRSPPALGIEAFVQGSVYALEGAHAEARASYRLAERLEGPTVTVLLANFAARLAGGQREEALQVLDRARALAPTDVRVLFHRGTTRTAAGDTLGARSDLRRALDLRPEAVGVAAALARLEVAAGRYEEALGVLRTTMRQSKGLEEDPLLLRAQRAAEREMIANAPGVADLRELRRSPAPETRRLLAYELARRTTEADAAEAQLRAILGDADEGVRVTALQVYLRPWLRRRIDEDAVLCRRIAYAMLEDPAVAVRAAAATVLGRTQSTLAVRALQRTLGGEEADGDEAVRLAAALGLANHDSVETRASLVGALEDPSPAVRKAAVGSLFQIAGTQRGFVARGAPEARAKAVAAWRAWLTER